MTTPVIRLATSADSDAILDIYTPYIETPITFEEDVPLARSLSGAHGRHPGGAPLPGCRA